MLDAATPWVVRFAPSPTGSLHLGNARTALLNFLLARKSGGRFLLRIEDTDTERSTFAAEAEILFALAWLGLTPDGPVVRQSDRIARYREVAMQLLDQGRAYPCFCSEKRLAAQRTAALEAGQAPRYDGRCRRIPQAEALARMTAGEPHTLRLAVEPQTISFDDAIKGPMEVPSSAFGDFVLLRSSGWPSYNFAVVVDDMDMGITLVVRGEDHLTNTARQILLYQALDAPVPRFAHHGLLVDRDGKKLSKRSGATTVMEAAQAGIPASALAQYLASISGAVDSAEPVTVLAELVTRFDPTSLGRGNAVFLPEDLEHLAARAFRALPPQEICPKLAAVLPQDAPWHQLGPEAQAAIVRAALPASRHIHDLRQAIEPFTEPFPRYSAAAIAAAREGQAVLAALDAKLAHSPEGTCLSPAEAGALLQAVGKECGVRGRALYHPLRLALTGTDRGPELTAMFELVPVEILRARLRLFLHPESQETPCSSTTP
ncbi:MAG: glutamate--tRNA ligase [Desulfomicrobiaceae bacterium]